MDFLKELTQKNRKKHIPKFFWRQIKSEKLKLNASTRWEQNYRIKRKARKEKLKAQRIGRIHEANI